MLQPHKLLIGILVVVYTLPPLVYMATFGINLSSQHMRWAEFGSAMSGIYAPIVALTTLMVLLAQVGLQKQINEHEMRQAHISQARADIEFYAARLSESIEIDVMPLQSFRSVLKTNFHPPTLDALDSEALRKLAANIDAVVPSVLGMWFGVYPILSGLAADDEVTIKMTLHSSMQKLIAMLSFETCVALDNFYRVRTEGRIKVVYRFSPLLEAK